MDRGCVPHPSVEERVARGRAARSLVPRSIHADWEPSPERQRPEDVLLEQAQARVPELVPIRHGRMLVSPFAFFRGAAALMAADLAVTPQSGLQVQLCGAAHVSNFGGFPSPDRELVFDINDFDETAPGPWEWGVKRPAASIAIAAHLGSGKAFERALATFAETYADQTEHDHAAIEEAAWAGRIAVERGV